MLYTLHVTERVNLGNYEHVVISGSIQFDADEVEGELAAFAREQLDVLLLSHRRRAFSLLPENSESFMLDHPALEI